MENAVSPHTWATERNAAAIEQAKKIEGIPWCDEYEKMISSMLYRSWTSKELEGKRLEASKICQHFNGLNVYEKTVDREESIKKRDEFLRSLLGACGQDPTIESPLSILYGCNTAIGDNFFGNVGLSIDDSAFVTIGKNVLVGPNVHFITVNHPTDVAARNRGGMFALPITVGNDCWIGARVTLLPGARIGDGCTIGAAAVVSGKIPAYSVAVGAPARVIHSVKKPDV
ncbi:acetyltransferase [Ascochyta rabiei]|uniref:Acetyltransferase n=1 Tax=Didymella rabiei TaxID=5454 RepID=A0A162ZHY2_DIDRA|nr:acetyltransferase [Ascochyta rabiei]